MFSRNWLNEFGGLVSTDEVSTRAPEEWELAPNRWDVWRLGTPIIFDQWGDIVHINLPANPGFRYNLYFGGVDLGYPPPRTKPPPKVVHLTPPRHGKQAAHQALYTQINMQKIARRRK